VIDGRENILERRKDRRCAAHGQEALGGLLAVALLCARLTAPAEDLPAAAASLKNLSLEELTSLQVDTVFGASKHEQKVTEAPSSVTIITRDEIQKSGYRTLGEILNSVPGLYVRSDRNFSLLGIRGFGRPGNYNTGFQILLDGHRLNDAVGDRTFLDNGFALDPDLIERVEVIRGPGASLYGNSAFLGVINIITRRGREVGGVEASVTGGSLGSYQGRCSYGQQFSNGVEMVVSGSYQNSDGYHRLYFKEFDTPANNYGVAVNGDGEKSWHLFSSVSWEDFMLEGSFVERTKQFPTAAYGAVFNDPRNQTKDSQIAVDLKYEHQFANQLDLLARIGYDWGTTVGTYVYANGTPDLEVNIDNFLSQRLTGDLQLRRTFFGKHTLTAGAQLVGNLQQNQRNYDITPAPATYLDDRRHGVDYALYLQDESKFFKNLIFNGGFRYDHFYSFGATINPRLALIYQPVELTTVKLLYGTAFRAPSPNELYYSDGGLSQVTSPGLQPETITTYELVLEQHLGKHLTASASGFYYEIKNLVEEVTLPPGNPNAGAIQLQNLGSANAKGLELAMKGSWAHGFESRASYTLTDARDGMTDTRLVNSPVHLVKLGLTAPLYQEKIFATLEWDFESRRLTLAGQSARAVGIANFTLFSRNLVKGLEVSASVYNLFDTKYSEPAGPEHVPNLDVIQQDGRTFRVQLTYRF